VFTMPTIQITQAANGSVSRAALASLATAATGSIETLTMSNGVAGICASGAFILLSRIS
jgi:hypothetical protein